MERALASRLRRWPVAFLPLPLSLASVALASAGLGTRTNPVKFGASVEEGGLATRVVAVDTDAWPSLKRTSPANRRPPAGASDVLVTIQATNHTKTAQIPFVNGTLNAIGASGRTYSSLTLSCGAIPTDVSSISPVPAEKTVAVHTCWQVANLDLKSLVMYYAPYSQGRKVYFALRPRHG